MTKYILALDQGTTSSRAIVFSTDGQIISQSKKEFTQYYPNPGWVEHNPAEILESQFEAIRDVLKSGVEISCIGITNQRETVVVWDRNTGKPVYNAIVWQCRRTSDFCEELKANGFFNIISQKTGLGIDAYFSASKIKWILDNIPDGSSRAKNGLLACGTIDSWLIYNLTGEKSTPPTFPMHPAPCCLIYIPYNGMMSFVKFLVFPKPCFPKCRTPPEC